LAAELADKVTKRAMGKAELPRDVRQGTPVQEVGTQGLIAALLGLLRLAEETPTTQVVHDRSSKCHIIFA